MIYIFPMTSATEVSAGAKITLLFAKETDDIAELTDEFQHLPIIYAVAKCKQKDMKFGDASALLGQFMQEISFERQDGLVDGVTKDDITDAAVAECLYVVDNAVNLPAV